MVNHSDIRDSLTECRRTERETDENEIAPRAIDREVALLTYGSYGMFFSSGSTCKTVSSLRSG